MQNKRGQELSTSTIILIILGLAVLVILVIGFTVGWQKILPWLSSNNVDTIVNQCQAACTTANAYGFCGMNRTLKADDLPGGNKEAIGTCFTFSNDTAYDMYGVGECPSLCE